MLLELSERLDWGLVSSRAARRHAWNAALAYTVPYLVLDAIQDWVLPAMKPAHAPALAICRSVLFVVACPLRGALDTCVWAVLQRRQLFRCAATPADGVGANQGLADLRAALRYDLVQLTAFGIASLSGGARARVARIAPAHLHGEQAGRWPPPPAARRMRTQGGEVERLMHVPLARLSTSVPASAAARPLTGSSDHSLDQAESGSLVFGHYRANTFAALREALTVDEVDFTDAFAQIRVPFAVSPGEGAQRPTPIVHQTGSAAQLPSPRAAKAAADPSGLAEVASSGASGSYFYFTPCKRFIVKTISKREKDRLVALAAALLSHVLSSPLREARRLDVPPSLIQYYGAYSIRVPPGPIRRALGCNFGRPQVYYVVMRNHLYGLAKPHLTFDLKGATFNRRRLGEHAADSLRSAIVEGQCADWSGTLLDSDWLSLPITLPLPPAVRVALALVLARDVRFLASQGLIDYSLLIGVPLQSSGNDAARVHECRPRAAAALPSSTPPHRRQGSDAWWESAPLQRSRASGAILGPSALVGIGIIDIFERWESGWCLQRAVLSAVLRLTCAAPADATTALPPRAYALRFEEFVAIEVLRLPREERDVLLPSWRHLWASRPRENPPGQCDELIDCYGV